MAFSEEIKACQMVASTASEQGHVAFYPQLGGFAKMN